MTSYQDDLAARPHPQSAISWTFDLDLAELLTAVGVPAGQEEDQEAVLAAEEAALESAVSVPVEVPGRIAEALPAGPGLAAWLAGTSLQQAGDSELPAILAGFRRVASWAQARELETAALIASRCAAAHPRIGTDDSGRPLQLPPEAAAQVALALGMSQFGAAAWTGLGMQLCWQLPETGAALADGQIDLGRARLIAETTSALSDPVAQAVEARVLPAAGEQTNTQLRASLRRAVIAADPEGAEQRRRDAERRARVTLHPDEDGTASLTGSNLPGVHAAAAMARISAMARALKASGAHGGLDLLRAHIMLGLLLGTLPLIPPSEGGPCDGGPPEGGPPEGGPPEGGPHGDGSCDESPNEGGQSEAGPSEAAPCDEDTSDDRTPGEGSSHPGPWPDIPPPGDADAPPPDLDLGGSPRDDLEFDLDEEDDDLAGPPPPWPLLPAELPAAAVSSGPDAGRPTPGRAPLGLLDVIVPWPVLAGSCFDPGGCDPAVLSRIGPLTRYQARELIALGLVNAATRWRVVLTDDNGCALAVEGFRPPGPAPGTAPAGPAMTTAVVGRVTITVRADHARDLRQSDGASLLATGAGPRQRLLCAAADAATLAAERLRTSAAADAANSGRCAHTLSSAAYRPSPRLREFVAARDVTCRFWTCGQPAWRGDLDHTMPWHDGGITCTCNLGALCRTHHQIKQLPGWRLEQRRPGYFTWTTPAGRIYDVGPDSYPAS